MAPGTLWFLMVGLLLVAVLAPERVDDPAAAYRLVAYPLLGLVAPIIGWRRGDPTVVHTAGSLIIAPFLIDSVGNVFGLYAEIARFDDVTHVGNWFLLCAGIGLILRRRVSPRGALAAIVVGIGSVLALVWELSEWAFFYDDPDRAGLYVDTLADQALGTAGAGVAALVLMLVLRPAGPERNRG